MRKIKEVLRLKFEVGLGLRAIAQAPLGHELFHVPQTQGESKIPSHAGHDDLDSKLAFPEQRRLADLHALTLPDQPF